MGRYESEPEAIRAAGEIIGKALEQIVWGVGDEEGLVDAIKIHSTHTREAGMRIANALDNVAASISEFTEELKESRIEAKAPKRTTERTRIFFR